MAGLLFMPGMETDPDIKNYTPESLESKFNTSLIEEEFGNQEMVMIVFEDSCILTPENLRSIKETVRQLSRLGSVENTISLFNIRRINGKDGMMMVDPAVKQIPLNSDDINILKSELTRNSLAMGTVVSEDFRYAAIAASLIYNKPENEILTEIEDIVQENKGPSKVYYGGLPHFRRSIMKDVRRDGLILVPLALIIMLIFLRLVFREWKGMVLPFSMVVLAIAVSMGLAPLLGWKLSVLSLLVPIMLIAVANDYGIHMIARYQELNRENFKGTNNDIIRETIRSLRLPIFFTGLTTIAGILGLLTHSIKPARHVGILASAGIAYAVILTLFLLPAWLSLLKRSRPISHRKSANSFTVRALSYISKIITGQPRKVLIISLSLTLIFALGILRITVDGNTENYFPDKHPIKQASHIVNDHFGGSQTISVMIDGDMKDPGLLKIMDKWNMEFKDLPGVGDSYSLSTVIKEMTKALYNEDEEGYNSIPPTRDAVAQVLELYNMSGDPDDFERIVDFSYTRANIIIRFDEPETEYVKDALAYIDYLSERDGVPVVKGGYAYIEQQFAESIIKGQIWSLVFAISVIIILLSIIFNSLKGGLISTIPIVTSVIFLLGFMGITGITLNSATALLSSVMIGVGVDYTIHFLWRYKEELKASPHKEAVLTTLTTTGRGIVFNAFSVIVGFSVLVFSGFTSIRFFGYLILISIGVCLISALFVIPSLMLVFKPDFIEPKLRIEQYKRKTNKHMKRAVILTLLLGISFILSAQETAVSIMTKSREVMKVGSFEAVAKLTIKDSRGRTRERSNITASKTFADGTEKRLIKFLSPADVEGTSMLIYDYDQGQDDMWIYLPALKRIRRIVSSDKGKSFMGSEFSNSDMSSPPIEDFNHKLLEENDKSWIIESVPVNTGLEDEYGYIRKISYINKSTYLLGEMQFFDFDNEMYKTIEIRETKKISDNKYIVTHMIANNTLKSRSSEIIMTEIRTGTAIKDELFSLAYLDR